MAGSREKCDYVVDELGFDAAIDYKSDDVPARLKELCPHGINVYWDNVGGPVTDAAIDQIAIFGRAVMSEGCVAQSNNRTPRLWPPLSRSAKRRVDMSDGRVAQSNNRTPRL